MNQSTMNFNNQDLPLFSGTPQIIRQDTAHPNRSPSQKSLFDCRFCLDRGIIWRGKRRLYCTCPVGQRLAKEYHDAH